MAVKERAMAVIALAGGFFNGVISFLVFSVLDLLDIILCYVYRAADSFMEAECRPCYCSPDQETVTCSSGSKILVSEAAEQKMIRVTGSKLQLEEISDTLFTRPSVISEIAMSAVKGPGKRSSRRGQATYTVNSSIVEMLQERIVGKQKLCYPRWSDCDCTACSSWASTCRDSLFVKVDGNRVNPQEDVLFIHGFISSSVFWTETLYPNFSGAAKEKYRFLAVDLLGFGRSPKPADSLYTLREHVDMIESSVLEAFKVKSFHIVAHSLGCVLALALAAKHRGSVKSLTLLAPPYFPTPKGQNPTQYMMRRVAPRRVWPAHVFGASVACWYEHVSRTVCLVLSKNHRRWEYLAKLLTLNRIRTYLIEGFFLHTHNAAWHTLHNTFCGSAGKMERYLEEVKSGTKCGITVYHGMDDTLIPVDCSRDFQARVPRAELRVVKNASHITIVVGRQEAFARELEEIWRNARG